MKLRPFELGLIVVFLVLGLLALLLLAAYRPSPGGGSVGTRVGSVTIWGTLPATAVEAALGELETQNEAFGQVQYQYINPAQFNTTLVNALADGRGPDLMLISHEALTTQRARIQPIPYDQFPIRDFRNRYLDGAEVFALPDGIYGYPIAVDPLMLYWNRDLLTSNGFLEAPATWEVLINTAFPRLIERSFDRTISRSVVAMGEYQNVRNAFATISMLLLQGGTQGVYIDNDNRYVLRLRSSNGGGDPLESAADFYTRFAQTNNALYSWNRTLREDRQEFVAEDLVFYFGFASEGRVIERINPNLSFDIAEVPQSAGATVRRTYGQFYTLAPLRSSQNKQGAYAVLQALGGAQFSSQIALASDMVPVYRAQVSAGSNDTYGRFAFQSAPIAYGWLNPARTAADEAFRLMVEDINDNRATVPGSVADAVTRLRDGY